MHQALRRALATLAAVALTTGLAACSDDGNAAPEPTVTVRATSPTTSPTAPSATPTPTNTPAQGSPEAFIKRWFEEIAHMEETGETKRFLAMSWDSCTTCRNLADHITRIYSAGGWVEPPTRTVTHIVKVQSKKGFHTYDATVDTSSSRRKEARDAQVINSPPAEREFRFEMRRDGGKWAIVLALGAPS